MGVVVVDEDLGCLGIRAYVVGPEVGELMGERRIVLGPAVGLESFVEDFDNSVVLECLVNVRTRCSANESPKISDEAGEWRVSMNPDRCGCMPEPAVLSAVCRPDVIILEHSSTNSVSQRMRVSSVTENNPDQDPVE